MKLKNKIKLLIACDGGAASGKTTAAKLISKKYKLHFLSSGLLYRYISYKLLSKKKILNKNTYIKKISDMDWGGSLFMSKALECVGEYQTLQSFFQIPDDKTKTDSETKIDNETIIKPDKPKDSQDEPPGQNPKEFNGLPETLFQG